jgi:hypothetical protein
MTPLPPTTDAWRKLSRLAAPVTVGTQDAPFGFASRVVAAWKANSRESRLATFEWLTLRGLAVAMVILAGSAAMGYDTLAGVFTGEASLVGGGWLDVLTLPL